MEPGENEDEKWGDDVEMHDHLDTPVESDDGDGMANGDDGESGNGDDAAKNNGQSDDDNTLVERAEPEEKKKRGKMAKTDEEKDATSARGQAATEALLSDRFVWREGKPEPFADLRRQSIDDWERGERESRCDFIDRLHAQWEGIEQETQRKILKLRSTQLPIPIGDDGEVEYVDFVWNGRKVHCETFLKVDLSDPKDGFKSSNILDDFDRKMADYDSRIFEERKVRTQLVQYIVALKATEAKLASGEGIKELIEGAYEMMDSLEPNKREDWIADAQKAARGEKVQSFPQKKGEYKKRHSTITEKWEAWGSGRKEWTKDKKLNNDRNLFASDPANGILRRPSANGDVKAIYIAFDNNDKAIAFLDPQGIPWSYDEDVHRRMKADTHEFYSTIKVPNYKGNKRHISQWQHLKNNPAIKPDWCGSDHYGHWHAQQHTKDPIFETSDSHGLNATVRQLLLQFLKYTGGPMTRVLDFWFGVWEPELRQRYRDIYADSPEFARLPPVNEDHPDTYCLRVSVCNRPTDEHRDQSDIKGGLTGLVHLGEFEGAAMCINKLGISLDGYGDGAVLLFRGTEMKHYISQWTGDYRYAFDHTTHQSVEDAIREHVKTGRWGPSKGPRQPKAPKDGKGARKSKKPDDEDDGKPDGGNASGKPQSKTKKRPRGDDEEQPDGGPAPKKRGKTSAAKGKGQVRATEQKGGRVHKKEYSSNFLEKGGHYLRLRKCAVIRVEKCENEAFGTGASAEQKMATYLKKGTRQK